ncbi:MAG: hypothetical protein L3J16_06670 [Anaerolineales bacterium]|nr:hypothetical protein [Anaerolineales bacterium]
MRHVIGAWLRAQLLEGTPAAKVGEKFPRLFQTKVELDATANKTHDRERKKKKKFKG